VPELVPAPEPKVPLPLRVPLIEPLPLVDVEPLVEPAPLEEPEPLSDLAQAHNPQARPAETARVSRRLE
jgi:hypothetical protein